MLILTWVLITGRRRVVYGKELRRLGNFRPKAVITEVTTVVFVGIFSQIPPCGKRII